MKGSSNAVKIKGIDISHWQQDRQNIDWKKVANDGVKFAFIKATEGTSYTDPTLKTNASGAKSAGIPIGFYHYAHFKNESQAVAEANYFYSKVKDIDFQLPLVLDIEHGSFTSLGKSNVTKLAVKFLETLKAKGANVMVYAYKAFFDSSLDFNTMKPYGIWYARYTSQESVIPNGVSIWQYTEKGLINGIKGTVDVNWSYVPVSELTKGKTVVKESGSSNPKPAPSPSKNSSSSSSYTVKKGDTLGGIASKFKTTTSVLVSLNNIKNPNVISVGQVIKLPTSTTVKPKPVSKPSSSTTYTVKKGDTLGGIASKFKTSVSVLTSLNNIKNPNVISVGQVIKLPTTSSSASKPVSKPSSTTYTVKKGDNLGAIAQQFGTTVSNLTKLNKLSNPNVIFPGQKLKIK
ncbi:glycoside hydrolase [Bacillus phage vB_BpuM-BpSp]|nr:glycoside hydrolase [Bacillus phage vB_BpuM-BpSp]